jgi:hypothetical protein
MTIASNLLARARRGRYFAGREPAPIVAWRYRQVALERDAHPFFTAKTTADAVDAILGFFQQTPGAPSPGRLNEFEFRPGSRRVEQRVRRSWWRFLNAIPKSRSQSELGAVSLTENVDVA